MRGQTNAIFNHLKEKGSITSLEAINLYGATRLSAIIYNLKHTYDCDIHTVMIDGVTRFGDSTKFAKYIYCGQRGDNYGTQS